MSGTHKERAKLFNKISYGLKDNGVSTPYDWNLYAGWSSKSSHLQKYMERTGKTFMTFQRKQNSVILKNSHERPHLREKRHQQRKRDKVAFKRNIMNQAKDTKLV